jgi:hypothetical protein
MLDEVTSGVSPSSPAQGKSIIGNAIHLRKEKEVK